MRSLQQAPSRQAARCSAAEAPAAGSPGPAGSPQAARRHVRAAVSDLDCSLPAPRRPSGSGSAGAMSRVGGALREQRGGGCVRLDERRASRAACLSCGLCAQLTWASRYLCTMRAGELGRRTIWGRWRSGFLTGPKWSGAPVRPAAWCAGPRSLDPVYARILYDIDCLWYCNRCACLAARWPRARRRQGHHNAIPRSAVPIPGRRHACM